MCGRLNQIVEAECARDDACLDQLLVELSTQVLALILYQRCEIGNEIWRPGQSVDVNCGDDPRDLVKLSKGKQTVHVILVVL